MTAESSFVETLADRRDDLRYRVGRVGMSLAEVSTGAGYAAWPTAPSPDFLDAAERVIVERERHVLAELLEELWIRG